MRESAEERVYRTLAELCAAGGSQGVETAAVARALNLSRNAASHYLNRLAEKKLAEKTGAKPVRWRAAEPKQKEPPRAPDAFAGFIGAEGSCRRAVDQCRAAVRYPAGGLPILLHGPSGVGKSFLARLIHRYAAETGALAPDAPFCTLNCADYANNPQLLTGTLFGYKKGAFTGAERDHPGMIQEAHRGTLFLDEVHRLSFENQEKLFILMDQGKYRPLGESREWKSARVRFIFATTEDLEEVLLATFRRRIPVKVELQAYSTRPLLEKLQLAAHLFCQEARLVHRDIYLPPEVLGYLCASPMEGNVGMLQNLARLSCANAFSLQPAGEPLEITLAGMDARGLGAGMRRNRLFARGLLIPWEGPWERESLSQFLYFDELGDFAAALEGCAAGDGPASLQMSFCKADLALKEHLSFSGGGLWAEGLYREMVEALVRETLSQYGIFPSASDLRHILRWYLCCCGEGEAAEAPSLAAALGLLRGRRPRAAYLIHRLLEEARRSGLRVPRRLGIFQAALFFLLAPSVDEERPLYGLIVAHGTGTATSIARVANTVCRSFVYEAFDMPMDTSVDEIICRVKDFIEKIDTRSGLVLLVDMGSLEHMYSSIKNSLKGDLLIVNNLTTSVAMDIGFKMVNSQPFRRIAEAAWEGYHTEAQYYEGIAYGRNIIISCISGLGIANKLREIVQEQVDGDRLEVVSADYRTIKTALDGGQNEIFRNTQLIVTTSDTLSGGPVPILQLSKLWEPEGEGMLLQGLGDAIDRERFERLKGELLKFFSVEGVSGRLTFLNPKVIIDEVEGIIDQYEQYTRAKMESFKRLNLYLHISAMIERLMVGDDSLSRSMECPVVTPEMREFFDDAQRIFGAVTRKYNIRLNEYELALLYELINS